MCNISDENILAYWGYWARHINNIRYKSEILELYKNLMEIMKHKNYFICTTNADGQVQRVGFDKERIFAPQGNYDSFQCSIPCRWDEIYPNKEMIENMVASIDKNYKIDSELIPRCSHCGNYLIPNLRCDSKFVEKPHFHNVDMYEKFINENSDKNILFLELGVGFNTPGIICYPFERLTNAYENAKLIRVNKGSAELAEEIIDKSIEIGGDIKLVLSDILGGMNNE